MRYLICALLLTACGLTEAVDNIKEAVEPPPKAVNVERVFQVRQCAKDSVEAADTANFEWCNPGKPPNP